MPRDNLQIGEINFALGRSGSGEDQNWITWGSTNELVPIKKSLSFLHGSAVSASVWRLGFWRPGPSGVERFLPTSVAMATTYARFRSIMSARKPR